MCSKKKLDEKVHLLKELMRQSDDLNTRIENLKNELKEEMTTRGVSELKGEDWIVDWSTVSSNRFDQTAFKLAHPELYEKFKKLSESRRFTVK